MRSHISFPRCAVAVVVGVALVGALFAPTKATGRCPCEKKEEELPPCTCPTQAMAQSYTITGTARFYSGPNGTGYLVHTSDFNFAASATQNQCEWYGGNDDGLVYAQTDGSSRPCPWHISLSGLYLPNVWFYLFHMYKASGATPVGNYGDSAWYNDTYGGGGSVKLFGVKVTRP